MIFMKKIIHFWHLKKTGYGPSVGPSIRRTIHPTDMISYRDARTHLKTQKAVRRSAMLNFGADGIELFFGIGRSGLLRRGRPR